MTPKNGFSCRGSSTGRQLGSITKVRRSPAKQANLFHLKPPPPPPPPPKQLLLVLLHFCGCLRWPAITSLWNSFVIFSIVRSSPYPVSFKGACFFFSFLGDPVEDHTNTRSVGPSLTNKQTGGLTLGCLKCFFSCLNPPPPPPPPARRLQVERLEQRLGQFEQTCQEMEEQRFSW